MAVNLRVEEDQESLGKDKIQPLSLKAETKQCWNIEERKKQASSTLVERLRLKDIFSSNVWQASLGELLGTTILVFMIDTIVISSYETKTITPNLIISILVGLTITILILAIFPIFGGHINPIISFFAAHVDLISFSRATVYIVAQCLGGALGAVALKAVVDSTIEQTFSLGGCTLSVIAPRPNGPIVAGLAMGQELWFKIICTFVFLFASIWIAFDDRQAKALIGSCCCFFNHWISGRSFGVYLNHGHDHEGIY
ncbi:Aquaporin NIP3-3 [Camellia lanceoleosa]|uniref:Aquaporin NIP3-3 n=1 Tax=Camellia lanceoleosa TaxID=1840588 RepID=A0ACC0HJV7_9ERIC|nr:Aquaporin NIP3-3 [Camellia lanceoleosa]